MAVHEQCKARKPMHEHTARDEHHSDLAAGLKAAVLKWEMDALTQGQTTMIVMDGDDYPAIAAAWVEGERGRWV